MKITLSLLSLCLASGSALAAAEAWYDSAAVGGLVRVAQQAPALSKDLQYHNSFERRAAALEAYRLAASRLAAMASAAEKGRPLAVVLDVDDTVLDNQVYQLETEGKYDPKTWDAWVRREEATAVPGVKAFLDFARDSARVQVVFITDRTKEQEEPTIANMRKLGLFRDGDMMLGKDGPQDNKGVRRRCVEAREPRCAAAAPGTRIAMLIGDSLRDFAEIYASDLTPEFSRSLASDPRWGDEWIVIPNPTYGQWQRGYK